MMLYKICNWKRSIAAVVLGTAVLSCNLGDQTMRFHKEDVEFVRQSQQTGTLKKLSEVANTLEKSTNPSLERAGAMLAFGGLMEKYSKEVDRRIIGRRIPRRNAREIIRQYVRDLVVPILADAIRVFEQMGGMDGVPPTNPLYPLYKAYQAKANPKEMEDAFVEEFVKNVCRAKGW